MRLYSEILRVATFYKDTFVFPFVGLNHNLGEREFPFRVANLSGSLLVKYVVAKLEIYLKTGRERKIEIV